MVEHLRPLRSSTRAALSPWLVVSRSVLVVVAAVVGACAHPTTDRAAAQQDMLDVLARAEESDETVSRVLYALSRDPAEGASSAMLRLHRDTSRSLEIRGEALVSAEFVAAHSRPGAAHSDVLHRIAAAACDFYQENRDSVDARRRAMAGLGSSDGSHGKTTSLLLSIALDRSEVLDLRVAAVVIVGRHQFADVHELVGPLAELATSYEVPWHVRHVAVRSLGSVAATHPSARDAILHALGDAQPNVQDDAVLVLHAHVSAWDRELAGSVLRSQDGDAERARRIVAASRAVTDMTEAPEFVRALIKLANSPDEGVLVRDSARAAVAARQSR